MGHSPWGRKGLDTLSMHSTMTLVKQNLCLIIIYLLNFSLRDSKIKKSENEVVIVQHTTLMQVQVSDSTGKNISEYIFRKGFGNIHQKLFKCV